MFHHVYAGPLELSQSDRWVLSHIFDREFDQTVKPNVSHFRTMGVSVQKWSVALISCRNTESKVLIEQGSHQRDAGTTPRRWTHHI